MEKEAIIYKGREYHRYPNSKFESVRKYFKANVNGKPVYLHRQVWEDQYGKIPDGYQIHHKDGDTANNDISNLELLENSEHQRLHGGTLSDAERDKLRKRVDEIRHLTVKWHRSEEGRAWHREHAKKTIGVRKEYTGICQECGATYISTTSHQKFCSNKCKARARRKSAADKVVKTCEYCGVEFISNKYDDSKFCSNKCGKLSYWAKIQK